jgi:predicted metal-dependent phosphoesterase TrpH
LRAMAAQTESPHEAAIARERIEAMKAAAVARIREEILREDFADDLMAALRDPAFRHQTSVRMRAAGLSTRRHTDPGPF